MTNGGWPLLTGDLVCPGCKGTKKSHLGSKRSYHFFECSDCGIVSTIHIPEPDEIERIEMFKNYYQKASFETPNPTAVSLDRLVISFERFRSTGRWIDIGYGRGGLLIAAERHGWRCHGTELDLRALEYGRRRGWVVAGSAQNNGLFPEEGFDVVTMIEVLEHIRYPEECLKTAMRLLRPGGVFYLTTPNSRSLNRRFLGLEWGVFCPPDHLTIWTVSGLRMSLPKFGFKCRKVRTEGLNPCEIIHRFHGKKRCIAPPDWNRTGATLNEAFSKTAFRRLLKRSVNRLLSAFHAGDSIKVLATRDKPSFL